MVKSDFLYDIYVLQTSGLPIFAGCTGTDYCKNHFEQHELHAGFFSALYMFSKESAVGTNLNAITFDDIQINFKINEDAEIMIVLVHPKTTKAKKVESDLDNAHTIFMEKYYPKLDKDMVETSIVAKYPTDLLEYGVIHSQDLAPTKDIQMDKTSFFKKWFKKA